MTRLFDLDEFDPPFNFRVVKQRYMDRCPTCTETPRLLIDPYEPEVLRPDHFYTRLDSDAEGLLAHDLADRGMHLHKTELQGHQTDIALMPEGKIVGIAEYDGQHAHRHTLGADRARGQTYGGVDVIHIRDRLSLTGRDDIPIRRSYTELCYAERMFVVDHILAWVEARRAR
jgi:hypothetical protein